MEFWGAEVKSGQIFEVELDDDGSRILHLSQVALGEVTGDNKKEKGNETVFVYLKFKNEKFVVGTLSQEKFPQIPLDLVLHDKFELSHTWKNGSVYFTGYYVHTSQGGDTESEEELAKPTTNLMKPQTTSSDPTTSTQVKIVEPKKDEDSSDDEDEESSEDQEPGMQINGEDESDDATDSDEDDSEEESSDEDEETPKKAGLSKKRSAESATKTPAPEKKVKLVTTQKTDSKNVGGHTATPHPSKQAGKASVAAAAAKVKQTPKSGGSPFSCKSCGRSFGSENALQSHSKAKHGAAA